MRYYHNRKSLIPCECEYSKIEDELIDSMPTFIVNDIKDILNIVNEQK